MMAHGPRQRNRFRRRMEGLTDYRRRLKLLRSRKSRAVVRISNTRTTCQLVDWSAEGDKVSITQTGGDLVANYGWPENMSQKNIPASYLAVLQWAKQHWLLATAKPCSTSVLPRVPRVRGFSQHSKAWSMPAWIFHIAMKSSLVMNVSAAHMLMMLSPLP